ncbi:integral membrane protein-like protein TmpA [Dactylonectria estremocensis]|uniref:Integral membrane protein-like protein TmpA n=1 Tax=Dactylonectria estremocensis TaxID=1079267 RepID=A0A9P9F9T4_9HYPO|nr:integral membrane protein-like protein TmpA [Dactylonectria estremocensis]
MTIDSRRKVPRRGPGCLSLTRLLRFLSSEYRILFTLVFLANFAGMVLFLWLWFHHGQPTKGATALATSINLVISVVIREEHVVNALYYVFTAFPKTYPLWFRRRMAKIYHLGGLHSGCGVAATFWFVLLSIEKTASFSSDTDQDGTRWAHIVVVYMLDCLLIAMLVMAYPAVRVKMHNAFEAVHRLAGWSSLGLLWCLTVLDASIDTPQGQSNAVAVFSSANFWLVLISTCSVVSTWMNCRKIPVQSERLSSHAIRMYFTYDNPQPGTTIRLSSRPLFEWHAFATVNNPKETGFSVVISNAGDWTNKVINNPPREIWVRRTPTCGVLRIAPMFNSILLVATGSGIAPCLPVILAQQTIVHLFWSTRDPLETYGANVASVIINMGENAHIHNTSISGRPNTLPTIIDLYKRTGSEAVVVISNPKLTVDLVLDLEALGMAAFGPIWDS